MTVLSDRKSCQSGSLGWECEWLLIRFRPDGIFTCCSIEISEYLQTLAKFSVPHLFPKFHPQKPVKIKQTRQKATSVRNTVKSPQEIIPVVPITTITNNYVQKEIIACKLYAALCLAFKNLNFFHLSSVPFTFWTRYFVCLLFIRVYNIVQWV